MYDSSPESCVHGAVYRLLLMYIALNYCEYKAKKKNVFTHAFVTRVAFLQKNKLIEKNIGH